MFSFERVTIFIVFSVKVLMSEQRELKNSTLLGKGKRFVARVQRIAFTLTFDKTSDEKDLNCATHPSHRPGQLPEDDFYEIIFWFCDDGEHQDYDQHGQGGHQDQHHQDNHHSHP